MTSYQFGRTLILVNQFISDLLSELLYSFSNLVFRKGFHCCVVHSCCAQCSFFNHVLKHCSRKIKYFCGKSFKNLLVGRWKVFKTLLVHPKMTEMVLVLWRRKRRVVGFKPSFNNRINRFFFLYYGSSLFFFTIFFGSFLGKPTNAEMSSGKINISRDTFGDHYSQNYLYIHEKNRDIHID